MVLKPCIQSFLTKRHKNILSKLHVGQLVGMRYRLSGNVKFLAVNFSERMIIKLSGQCLVKTVI